jgi:hypothetical protein
MARNSLDIFSLSPIVTLVSRRFGLPGPSHPGLGGLEHEHAIALSTYMYTRYTKDAENACIHVRRRQHWSCSIVIDRVRVGVIT